MSGHIINGARSRGEDRGGITLFLSHLTIAGREVLCISAVVDLLQLPSVIK